MRNISLVSVKVCDLELTSYLGNYIMMLTT